MAKLYNADKWGVEFVPENLQKHFIHKKQNLIYLSSDANEEMDEFEEDKIYIIGKYNYM